MISLRKILENWLGLKDANQRRIDRLRRKGVKIGAGCLILADNFSTEPYLVEIGDHVAIAGGTAFLTHDAAVWLIRDKRPDIQHFGRIRIGNNTYIGQNCLLLPGTLIGNDCVIGAGSVVRGRIPGGSVALGNPAKIIGPTALLLDMLANSKDSFDSLSITFEERQALLARHFGLQVIH